jgi:hypothetical protein
MYAPGVRSVSFESAMLKSVCHVANLQVTTKVAQSDGGAGPELDFDFLARD